MIHLSSYRYIPEIMWLINNLDFLIAPRGLRWWKPPLTSFSVPLIIMVKAGLEADTKAWPLPDFLITRTARCEISGPLPEDLPSLSCKGNGLMSYCAEVWDGVRSHWDLFPILNMFIKARDLYVIDGVYFLKAASFLRSTGSARSHVCTHVCTHGRDQS